MLLASFVCLSCKRVCKQKVGYVLWQQKRHLFETQGGRCRVDRASLFDLNKNVRSGFNVDLCGNPTLISNFDNRSNLVVSPSYIPWTIRNMYFRIPCSIITRSIVRGSLSYAFSNLEMRYCTIYSFHDTFPSLEWQRWHQFSIFLRQL